MMIFTLYFLPFIALSSFFLSHIAFQSLFFFFFFCFFFFKSTVEEVINHQKTTVIVIVIAVAAIAVIIGMLLVAYCIRKSRTNFRGNITFLRPPPQKMLLDFLIELLKSTVQAAANENMNKEIKLLMKICKNFVDAFCCANNNIHNKTRICEVSSMRGTSRL